MFLSLPPFSFSSFSVQVNNVDFANIIREEAVLFLLDLPRGEEVTILAQKKKDGEFVCWSTGRPQKPPSHSLAYCLLT